MKFLTISPSSVPDTNTVGSGSWVGRDWGVLLCFPPVGSVEFSRHRATGLDETGQWSRQAGRAQSRVQGQMGDEWGGGEQQSGLDGQHHALRSKYRHQALNSPKYSAGAQWLGDRKQARGTTKCSGHSGWEDNTSVRTLLPPRCLGGWADSPTVVPEGARR